MVFVSITSLSLLWGGKSYHCIEWVLTVQARQIIHARWPTIRRHPRPRSSLFSKKLATTWVQTLMVGRTWSFWHR